VIAFVSVLTGSGSCAAIAAAPTQITKNILTKARLIIKSTVLKKEILYIHG
jgi:hypothetical protein